jgi:4-carboxymuconolactone decarboxylase
VSLRRPERARVAPIAKVVEKARPHARAANVRGTMAHHRGLYASLGPVFDVILKQGITPRRQRELVILRTGWNCQAVYEFGQHTLYGREEGGLTDAEIYAVTRPLGTYQWSEDDRVLLQMADDLRADFCVTDETWAELTARWSTPEVTEFVMATMCYMFVSGFLNTMGVELDDGVPGWPSAPS